MWKSDVCCYCECLGHSALILLVWIRYLINRFCLFKLEICLMYVFCFVLFLPAARPVGSSTRLERLINRQETGEQHEGCGTSYCDCLGESSELVRTSACVLKTNPFF